MEKLTITFDEATVRLAYDAFSKVSQPWQAVKRVFAAAAQKQVDEWMARVIPRSASLPGTERDTDRAQFFTLTAEQKAYLDRLSAASKVTDQQKETIIGGEKEIPPDSAYQPPHGSFASVEYWKARAEKAEARLETGRLNAEMHLQNMEQSDEYNTAFYHRMEAVLMHFGFKVIPPSLPRVEDAE